METNRQKKIASVIQEDLAEILQKALSDTKRGVLITVTKVMVTPDLAEAKVYLSVFPTENREKIIEDTKAHTKAIKYQLGQRTKNQLRRIPDLHFFVDDSLDYIDGIEKALKGEVENPIENPDILPRRRKI